MRSIDHPTISHKYSNMSHVVCAVATVGPENKIASFGIRTWDMFTHGRMVLGLSCAWNSLIHGLANGVLC